MAMLFNYGWTTKEAEDSVLSTKMAIMKDKRDYESSPWETKNYLYMDIFFS